jgi:hypothetical protein
MPTFAPDFCRSQTTVPAKLGTVAELTLYCGWHEGGAILELATNRPALPRTGRTEGGEDDKAHARIAGIEGNDGHLHFECIQLNRATNQIVHHSHVGVQADVIQVDGHWLVKDAKAIPQPQL